MNSIAQDVLERNSASFEDVEFEQLSFEEYLRLSEERHKWLEAAVAKTKRELPWIEEGDVVFI